MLFADAGTGVVALAAGAIAGDVAGVARAPFRVIDVVAAPPHTQRAQVVNPLHTMIRRLRCLRRGE